MDFVLKFCRGINNLPVGPSFSNGVILSKNESIIQIVKNQIFKFINEEKAVVFMVS